MAHDIAVSPDSCGVAGLGGRRALAIFDARLSGRSLGGRSTLLGLVQSLRHVLLQQGANGRLADSCELQVDGARNGRHRAFPGSSIGGSNIDIDLLADATPISQ